MIMRTKLGKRGEFAIPPKFMKKLGVCAGDVLRVDAVDGDARLRSVGYGADRLSATCSASSGGAALISVSADGTIYLPPTVLDALSMNPGDTVLGIVKNDAIILYTLARLRQYVDGVMEKYPHLNGRTLSEELIRERRAEAKREEEKYG